MKPLEPVLTLHLFPEEGAALLKLLASLSAPKWDLQTVCSGWSVKDIAAHLLADDLGRLARGRDAYPRAAFAPSSPENIEAQLLEFINQQNESWVAAARRLSPRLLIDLLRDPRSRDFLRRRRVDDCDGRRDRDEHPASSAAHEDL